jgi:hypothetical protein
MTRPTTTLTLPVSGYTVEIVTYLTKGEDDAVDRHGMGDAIVSVEPDPETGQERYRLKNLPTDRFRREVAKLLELGIRSARKDGAEVAVGAEFVTDLPTKDVDLLTEKLIAVRAGDGDPKGVSPAPTS